MTKGKPGRPPAQPQPVVVVVGDRAFGPFPSAREWARFEPGLRLAGLVSGEPRVYPVSQPAPSEGGEG